MRIQALRMWPVVALVFLGLSQAWAARPYFKDEDLMQILAYSKEFKTAGLLYTWSPRMSLSSLGALEIQQVAHDLKLHLTILVDPNSTDYEITTSAQDAVTANSAYLGSAILSYKSVYLHYPGLLIYKNGKFRGALRPGYDEPNRIKSYILRRLQ